MMTKSVFLDDIMTILRGIKQLVPVLREEFKNKPVELMGTPKAVLGFRTRTWDMRCWICGEDVAMGSLITTKDLDMSPQDKIIKALEAAEQYCCGVQRPFHIICTDGRDEIVIK